MQMRSLRPARVSTICDEVTFMYGKQSRRNIQGNIPTLQFILFLFYISSQRRIECIQVRIQTHKPAMMPDINCLTKPKRFYLNPVYITVRHSKYRQVFPVSSADIKAHMIMIQPQLAEISCEADGNIQGVSEFIFGIDNRLEKLAGDNSTIQKQVY